MSHKLGAALAGAVAFLSLSVMPAQATTIVTPGESGVLSHTSRYTWIKATSPRPGGRYGYVYLGDGGATATYRVSVPASGRYAMWIRFDDDGLHSSGARAVQIYVNGALALTWSNVSKQTNGWINIPVGSVNLAAGWNTIVFKKAATTTAAYVMDEFVLTDVPGYVPN